VNGGAWGEGGVIEGVSEERGVGGMDGGGGWLGGH
jgi:hypothetical protein